jgi:hypothetical protein
MAKHKVVINRAPGEFRLSREAAIRGREISGNAQWADTILPEETHQRFEFEKDFVWMDPDHPRHDPVLVQVVEELGSKASGPRSVLSIAIVEESTYHLAVSTEGSESVLTPLTVKWITI